MNAQRRKRINDLIVELEEIQNKIDSLRDEEEEAYENLPESLQESEKGERMYENIDTLDNARSSIEEVKDYLEEAVQ